MQARRVAQCDAATGPLDEPDSREVPPRPAFITADLHVRALPRSPRLHSTVAAPAAGGGVLLCGVVTVRKGSKTYEPGAEVWSLMVAADRQRNALVRRQVWPMRGYALILNSNNHTDRSAAFQRAIDTRRTTSTGLTLVGSDWITRGVSRVATMLVVPLYWSPAKAQQQAAGRVSGVQRRSSAAALKPAEDPEAVLTGFLDVNFAWTSVRRNDNPCSQKSAALLHIAACLPLPP